MIVVTPRQRLVASVRDRPDPADLHVDHPLDVLHRAGDLEQRRRMELAAQPRVVVRHQHPVRRAGLVLERDEAEALRGARALAHDHVAGDANEAAVARAADLGRRRHALLAESLPEMGHHVRSGRDAGGPVVGERRLDRRQRQQRLRLVARRCLAGEQRRRIALDRGHLPERRAPFTRVRLDRSERAGLGERFELAPLRADAADEIGEVGEGAGGAFGDEAGSGLAAEGLDVAEAEADLELGGVRFISSIPRLRAGFVRLRHFPDGPEGPWLLGVFSGTPRCAFHLFDPALRAGFVRLRLTARAAGGGACGVHVGRRGRRWGDARASRDRVPTCTPTPSARCPRAGSSRRGGRRP